MLPRMSERGNRLSRLCWKTTLLVPIVVAAIFPSIASSPGASAGMTSSGWNLSGMLPRYGQAMVYQAIRGRVVLFGGFSGGYLGDTWEWDGVRWIQRTTPGPSPRYSHAMAYDAARDRVVLFGGRSEAVQYLDDTWEWDGTTWTKILSPGPSGRNQHAMAYDAARGCVVLFGGSNGSALGDTWEWNGKVWTLRASSGPPPRFLHALAYDAGRARIVLFGGSGASTFGDTWEWDGIAWTQRATGGPTPRYRHAMAYDTFRHCIVLSGGAGSNNAWLGDFWVWDGSTWIQGATTGLSQYWPSLAYDSARERVVLFVSGDTWEWDGAVWTQVISGRYGGEDYAMVYDVARDRIVLFGSSVTGNLPETWEWDGGSWSRRATTGPPNRLYHAMAYDADRRRVVLFGGELKASIAQGAGDQPIVPENFLFDTWEWDGVSWTQVATTGPPRRYGHAMTYDASRKRVLLFGGIGAGSLPLGDTWEWDGNTWQQRSSPAPARSGHAMVYDSARSRAVVFGGSPSSVSAETWEWDGTTWARVSTSGPGALTGHAMAYDKTRGKTILFGGGDPWSDADTWEWDGLTWLRMTSSEPPQRDDPEMAFDEARGSTVMFGGFSRHGSFSRVDTWEYCPATSSVYFRDEDGDGFGDPRVSQSACVRPYGYAAEGSDCDDTRASVHAGAPEQSDGIDNQCPGNPGYGAIDEIDDSVNFEDDKVSLTWYPQNLATAYQVARGGSSDFTGKIACFSSSVAGIVDTEVPVADSVFFYLVRTTEPMVGSWGRDSSGGEEQPLCP